LWDLGFNRASQFSYLNMYNPMSWVKHTHVQLEQGTKFWLGVGVGVAASFISPTHKRTEGSAPVWGSEFTLKDATLQGRSSRNHCWAKCKFWDSVTTWSRATPFLEQPSPRKFVFFLTDLKPMWFRLRYFAPCRLSGNARHRPEHVATRLPPAGPP
jgi:hypothetical protein